MLNALILAHHTGNKSLLHDYTMKKVSCWLLVSLVLAGVQHLMAQGGQPISGAPGRGSSAVTLTLSEIEAIDLSLPQETTLKIREELRAGNRFKIPSPHALPGNKYPNGPDEDISLMDNTQNLHSNFQGIQLSESNSIPPDCMGHVSHTQICVVSNGRIKFYTKPSVCDAPLVTSNTTNTGSLSNPVFSTTLRAFFNSVIGSADVTDPHVYFDRLTERWFVVAINTANASNRIMIAVSNNAVISGQSSFNFFFFNHDNGAPANHPDMGSFCDYPMVGLDKFALYIGGIIFNSSGNFIGSSVYVVNKNSLLSGGALQFTAFRQVGLVSTGIFAPQGVYNDDPEATRGFFIGVDNEVFSRLRFITVNNPGGTPTITQGTINVPSTYYPYEQPALGSNLPLDALGDERLLDAQMMRNKLTGQSAIWTAHHIAVNNTGIAVEADGIPNARNAMRWYQLAESSGVLTLAQSGTLFDNAPSNARGYWMGTIAASGQGHAVLATSVASPQIHANAVVAGRFFPQNPGILNPPINATNFTAVYNRETTGQDQRWGDYSHTVVDPSDDMTIWTFQQYTNSTNDWAVRAIQLKSPPPATPVSITASQCNNNFNSTFTLTGQSTGFSGFFDPGPPRGGPAYPKRLTVSSTGNVTIGNVEVLSTTQIRFTANLRNATLGSQQTLTITNPDCQSVTFRYMLPDTCSGSVNPQPVGYLQVSPNPVENGTMQVVTPEATGNLRLLATDGKVLEQWAVTGGRITLETRRYVTGVYFLEFYGSGYRQIIQVFINRK